MLRKKGVVSGSSSSAATGSTTCRSPTAPPSPTWRRSTAPPAASSRSTPRPALPAPDRPRRGDDRAGRGLRPRERHVARRGTTPAGLHRHLHLDMAEIVPAISGPKRPQDYTPLNMAADAFYKTVADYRGIDVSNGARAMGDEGGDVAIVAPPEVRKTARSRARTTRIRDGSVVIAAITSCTNTSNPYVMIGAGLVARKAGARPRPQALGQDLARARAPGGERLSRGAGLQEDLDAIGFNLAGYGCTTCIGNSGPLGGRRSRGDRRERPRGDRGALGQPQLRGADHPRRAGELPRLAAAGRRLRARRRRQ